MVENSEVGPAPSAPSAPFMCNMPTSEPNDVRSYEYHPHEVRLDIDGKNVLNAPPFNPVSSVYYNWTSSKIVCDCWFVNRFTICFFSILLIVLGIPLIVFFTKNSTEISNDSKNHSVIYTEQIVPGDAWDECGTKYVQWGCKDSCSCIQEPGNPYYWQCIPPGGIGNTCL